MGCGKYEVGRGKKRGGVEVVSFFADDTSACAVKISQGLTGQRTREGWASRLEVFPRCRVNQYRIVWQPEKTD